MGYGIGKRIKQRREELHLTQMELALRMGYTSKAAICKVERGDDNITSDRVSKFAKALNCTESYLMGWDELNEIHTKQIDVINQIRDLGKIPHHDYSEEEKKLLKEFRELSEESQRQLVIMLAFLKDQENKK